MHVTDPNKASRQRTDKHDVGFASVLWFACVSSATVHKISKALLENIILIEGEPRKGKEERSEETRTEGTWY